MGKWKDAVFGKVLSITGIEKAMSSPEVQGKELMKGNALLRDKRVFACLCVAITLVVLLCLNIFCRLIMNFGGFLLGSNSMAVIFLPSYRLIPIYILGLCISAALCVFISVKININFKDLNVGQKGKRRFMLLVEIAQRFPNVPEKDESFPGWGGAPVSRYEKRIYIDSTVVNNIIYAITRGGKTESLVVPTVDIVSRAEKKASMIIPDAKGTLANTTATKLIERGYRVFIYDMFDFDHTNFYNPMEVIRESYWSGNIDLAEELATDLAFIFYEDYDAKDKFWIEAPRSLFAACVLALVEDCQKENAPEKVSLYSVFVLMAALGSVQSTDKREKGLDDYFTSRPVTNPARLAYTSITFSEGKTRTSVLTLTLNKMDAYRRANIAKMTSRNDLDLTEIGFGEQPIAVILRVPFYNRSYDALVTTYIAQAFYMNMKKAAMSNNGKLARRVRVVGDEIFNFPAFKDLDNMVTVCLGTGWSFDFYAQSPVQVEKKYGDKVAKIVLDNCATTYFLASPDKDARQKISDLCGPVTIENVTRSGERFSLNKSITEQFEERPLIPIQELLELKDGEMIVYPTMHRKDLEGNKVVPLPIFNKDETSMLYRYEYLSEFDPDAPIPYESMEIIPGAIKEISLNDLVYIPPEIATEAFPEQLSNQLLRDVMMPSQMDYISRFLPGDLEVDLSQIDLATFDELIQMLHTDGVLSDVGYKTVNDMLPKVRKGM